MLKLKIWTILICITGIIFSFIGLYDNNEYSSRLLTIGNSLFISSVTTYFSLKHYNK